MYTLGYMYTLGLRKQVRQNNVIFWDNNKKNKNK